MALAPIVVSVALLALAAAPSSAPPSDEVRARVRSLLLAIDRPVSPDAIRAVGPGAEDAVAEIALSRDMPVRRARALEVLERLHDGRAEEIHRTLAADTAAPRTVRRSAVRGLARLVAPARAGAELRPLLERDPDGAIRAAAATALADRDPAGSCALVRAQAAREKGEERRMFDRAVAACAGRR